MSNPAEKQRGFERWVASLRVQAQPRARASEPPAEDEVGDDQATAVQRLPPELIRSLREREARRGLPQDTDSTAVFVPPPELLARAKRFVPPPKPTRSDASSSEAALEPPAPASTEVPSTHELRSAPSEAGETQTAPASLAATHAADGADLARAPAQLEPRPRSQSALWMVVPCLLVAFGALWLVLDRLR